MGLFDWLLGRKEPEEEAEASAVESELAPGCPADEWEEIPAYVPCDPAEHVPAVVIASAIAAGERAQSDLTVKKVLIANPEHQRVTAVAAAIAAGALEESEFTVKKVYRRCAEGLDATLEESHAA